MLLPVRCQGALAVALSLLVTLLITSCASVGPAAVSNGRLAYNAAITETNSEQILMALVHNRYEERSSLLAVSSVTANVRVSARATVEAGFGDSDNYEGNLVPFRGGFVYEENPTISYLPVEGERYFQQLSAQLPVAMLSRIWRALPEREFAMTALVSSINGIHNEDFLYGDRQHDPRFARAVSLMSQLGRDHRLHWVEDPARPGRYALHIDASGNAEAAIELVTLLGLAESVFRDQEALIPVYTSPLQDGAGGLLIITRSVLQLVQILSATVEVPPGDEQQGIARSFAQTGQAARGVSIHYADSAPDNAYVSVPYRDGWFYIDERDQATKRYFKLLGSLWSAAMSSAIEGSSGAPVLTVPVSR